MPLILYASAGWQEMKNLTEALALAFEPIERYGRAPELCSLCVSSVNASILHNPGKAAIVYGSESMGQSLWGRVKSEKLSPAANVTGPLQLLAENHKIYVGAASIPLVELRYQQKLDCFA